MFNNKPDREEIKVTQEVKIASKTLLGAMTLNIMTLSIITFIQTTQNIIALGILKSAFCGLYYKPMTIVNDDSSIVRK